MNIYSKGSVNRLAGSTWFYSVPEVSALLVGLLGTVFLVGGTTFLLHRC